MFGTSILPVSQSKNPQNTVWVLFLESFEGVGSNDNCIIHQSGSSGGCFSHQSVKVINGLGEATLIVDHIVEEEQRNYVFEVVSNGPVGKGLKERLNSTDPLEIRLVEESAAH